MFNPGQGFSTHVDDSAGDGITNPAAVAGSQGLTSIYADDDGGYTRLRGQAYYAAPYSLLGIYPGTSAPTTTSAAASAAATSATATSAAATSAASTNAATTNNATAAATSTATVAVTVRDATPHGTLEHTPDVHRTDHIPSVDCGGDVGGLHHGCDEHCICQRRRFGHIHCCHFGTSLVRGVSRHPTRCTLRMPDDRLRRGGRHHERCQHHRTHFNCCGRRDYGTDPVIRRLPHCFSDQRRLHRRSRR